MPVMGAFEPNGGLCQDTYGQAIDEFRLLSVESGASEPSGVMGRSSAFREESCPGQMYFNQGWHVGFDGSVWFRRQSTSSNQFHLAPLDQTLHIGPSRDHHLPPVHIHFPVFISPLTVNRHRTLTPDFSRAQAPDENTLLPVWAPYHVYASSGIVQILQVLGEAPEKTAQIVGV